MTERSQQLKAIVEDLWEATSPLAGEDVPKNLRTRTFERLLENWLTESEQGISSSGNGIEALHIRGGPTAEPLDSVLRDEIQRADAVSDRFRIEANEAGDLFDLSSEDPVLNVHRSKLSTSFKAGQKEIALLMCGARTALGLETGSRDIRVAAERYGKLDSNFMTNLSSFQEFAVRGLPASQNRQVRIKGKGWEALWELAARLTSDGD